ncbi:MAG TPA: 30S ribosomal protein S14 [Bauldia sp.]|jgi:small subunit ribosomal protein S14
MAKKSSIEKNNRRRKMVARLAGKRAELKRMANDESISQEERFQARLKLAEMPRNSSAVRIRNRCEITGRPRGVYRKLRMSRIALRDLGSAGMIPGLVKSSW